MQIVDFRADADIVGRRIRISWRFSLETTDTLADIPAVTVRRKTRDFEFPAPGVPDTFLLYNSATFPPAPNPPAVLVNDLPGWETNSGGQQTTVQVTTVSTQIDGRPVETLRSTTFTTFGPDGWPLERRVEILDYGSLPAGLLPGTTYYYQIFSPLLPAGPNTDPAPYRAVATPTESYGLNRALYESLPAIYRRHDVVSRVPTPGADGVPEAAPRSGQLRRFLDLFGIALDSLRSTAESLRGLHDLDNVDYRYLPLLAQWIGWELSFDVAIPIQRNELKSAARLYRGVGTIPAIRAIVDRYTGWYSQVAEFAQHIARANTGPQYNLFARVQYGAAWRGTEDAATLLGFGTGNDTGAGFPATLLGTTAEPFTLRPGMQLSLTANNDLPGVVRFERGDFLRIDAATAAEIAAVINRVLPEVTATPRPGGRLQIASNLSSPDSALQINTLSTSLITLDGAPGGRLSAFVDSRSRVRLFYETLDPLAPDSLDADLSANPLRIRYKTFANGVWGNSHALDIAPSTPRSAPVAVERPGGNVWAAWIDFPNTEKAQLRFTVGTVPAPQKARLIGQRRGPFAIPADTRLSLRGDWDGTADVAFLPGDFADPQHATPNEVVTALNARLTHATATMLPNNAIALDSLTDGPNARLEIDVRRSNHLAALGLVGSVLATGSWDDTISWQAPQNVASAGPGRHADLFALQTAAGVVWLFWSRFETTATTWQIVSSRWDGANWTAPELLANSPGGDREPCAALDGAGRIWLFWSQRQGFGTPEDVWTLRRRVFDPGTNTWSAEAAVTTAAAPRSADRELGVVAEGGNMRLFFRSDRAGGPDLWTLTVDGAGIAGTPLPIEIDAEADRSPAPVRMPDGSLWLLYRSDHSVPLAQVASYSVLPGATDAARAADRSLRVPDNGSVRRYAGTVSVVPADLTRSSRHRLWDDLIAYTPQKPFGPDLEDPLTEDELYTRGTLGLYVSRPNQDMPLTAENSARLRQLLERFLPMNTRAVVILAPLLDVEFLYRSGADIGESYLDDYPFADTFVGLADSTAAVPQWGVLLSNTAGNVSANPADLTSLRHRTFFPPLQ